jgi:hypothetical protein
MAQVQVIPYAGDRVESGPVQFGPDDWPGLFLRGDNALAYALALERVLTSGGSAMDRTMLRDLLAALQSVQVDSPEKIDDSIRLAPYR